MRLPATALANSPTCNRDEPNLAAGRGQRIGTPTTTDPIILTAGLELTEERAVAAHGRMAASGGNSSPSAAALHVRNPARSCRPA